MRHETFVYRLPLILGDIRTIKQLNIEKDKYRVIF